jgi:uncharacterized protein YceK
VKSLEPAIINNYFRYSISRHISDTMIWICIVMKNLISKISILFMFAILSGCASITESKNQSMSVTTGEVTGAMCTLSNSKGSYYVTTPGSVMVRNACDQLAISCTKEGYVPANPAAGTVQDKAKKMAWGNIVFGGIIGIAVDRSTGAGCQYPQQNIYYPMKKASQ